MAGLSRPVLVFGGQHTCPVSFSAGATPEETCKILKSGIFVDLIPQDVQDRSVVKVLLDDCVKQVSMFQC